jgi:hypothetical protein
VVKCDQCKTDHRWKYMVKFNGKIVAHLCSDRCLMYWATRNELQHRLDNSGSQQAQLYDHRVTDATIPKGVE